MTTLQERVRAHFEESIAAKRQTVEVLAEPTAEAAMMLIECLMNDGKILVCGNGGSAADAQHFAAELTGRFEKERMELAAIALTTGAHTPAQLQTAPHLAMLDGLTSLAAWLAE